MNLRVSSAAKSSGNILLVAGILLIAANLRAPVTGLAPLLTELKRVFSLGQAEAGVLTTLPLLAFALFSPLSVLLAKRFGLERSLFGALLAIATGILIRSQGSFAALLLGTAIVGMGIAVGNVLLPSVVKRDLPNNITSMTGLYTIAMGIFAAAGSAAVVPLAQAFGWQTALLAFLLIPAGAMAVWAGQLRKHTAPATSTATVPASGDRIWRVALAWQVTLYLSLNSTIYYIAIGYLPSILAGSGLSAAKAGSLHGVLQLATAIPGLILGGVVKRRKDQRLPAFAASLFTAIALLGFIYLPQYALLWTVLFGLGTGAVFILGLSFIGLRAKTNHRAAELSGMAQSFGYFLAALGPVAAGKLYEVSQGWNLPLGACVVLALACAFFGWLSGRAIQIE